VVQVRQAKEIMVALVQVLGRHLVRAAVAALALWVETELEVSVATAALDFLHQCQAVLFFMPVVAVAPRFYLAREAAEVRAAALAALKMMLATELVAALTVEAVAAAGLMFLQQRAQEVLVL
jgi:hypothetical protein